MPDMRGELLTDASSWRLLTCYMDAAAWIGVPAAWPPATRVPGTDFGRVAVTALDAVTWGLPERQEVRVAVILAEADTWLRESQTLVDDDAIWAVAKVYARALSPVLDLPVALGLLQHPPTERERRAAKHEQRRRRRRPLVPWRHKPANPYERPPALWWKPLWQQRMSEQKCETRPILHATAALATAIWSTPGAVRDPIGVRQELRDRVVKARAWAGTDGSF